MTAVKPTKKNPLLVKFAVLVRDISGWKEYNPANATSDTNIMIGRENFPQNDFKTDYVVIDQLGDSVRDSSGEKFNGATEIMSYDAVFKTTVTIDFMGDNAHERANRLWGLLRSQNAFDKKYALGIGVYQVSSIADIKQLTGQQYGNRVQMSVVVQDCRKVDIETLRIDTPQFKILTEDKEITL